MLLSYACPCISACKNDVCLAEWSTFLFVSIVCTYRCLLPSFKIWWVKAEHIETFFSSHKNHPDREWRKWVKETWINMLNQFRSSLSTANILLYSGERLFLLLNTCYVKSILLWMETDGNGSCVDLWKYFYLNVKSSKTLADKRFIAKFVVWFLYKVNEGYNYQFMYACYRDGDRCRHSDLNGPRNTVFHTFFVSALYV